MIALLVPLAAAIAPFVIWPIELFLPYPYIIEETAKVFLITFVINLPSRVDQVKIVLASALLFTLSETVLYIFNVSMVGDISTLLTRLILTAALHSLTILVILISAFKYKGFMIRGYSLLIPVGVLEAMLIHYLFNWLVIFF